MAPNALPITGAAAAQARREADRSASLEQAAECSASLRQQEEERVHALMQGLPDDVTLHVLGMLDAGSLGRCTAVSRDVRRLATARQLWLRLLVTRAAAARGWIICERQLEGVSRAGVVAALGGSGRVTTISPRRSAGSRAPEAVAARRRRPPLAPTASPSAPACPAAAPAPAPSASSLLAVDPNVRRMYRISGTSVQFTGPLLGMDRAVRCEAPLPSAPHAWLRAVAGRPSAPPRAACGSATCAPVTPLVSPVAPHAFVVETARVGYFEVTIGPTAGTSSSRRDCIAVGLGSSSFPLHGKQPGWDTCSFGYHSDDGHAFHGHGTSGRPFGQTFGPGDVIGCGISLISRRVFFSKNGRYIGAPFTAQPGLMPLHPLVGLDSPAPVRFNLGDRPFLLDLDFLPASLHANPVAVAAAATAAARAPRESFGAAFRSALACVVPKFGGGAADNAGPSAVMS
jgi:hypothetical protein